MRSFAVIAGFAAATNALVAKSEAYYASSSEAAYYASSSTPAAYYASSTPAAYYASSSAAGYASSSSAAGYYASSSAPVYDSYSTKVPTYETPIGYSTTVISKYETDCPEPTTITWNQKTYTVTKSTKLTITEPCTTTVPVYASAMTSSVSAKTSSASAKTSSASAKISSAVYTPSSAAYTTSSASKSVVSAKSSSVPAWASKVSSGAASGTAKVPYYPTASNGTSYTPPKATGTGVASSTKPGLPESTGAAAQMGVGMLAIIGAVAAFL